MEFTTFEHHRDKATDRRVTLDWAAVMRHLSTHVERGTKEGPGFSPAKYLHTPCYCGKDTCPHMRGHATNANVVESYMMAIDLDKGVDGQDLTEVEARQHLATIAATGLAFVAHTTYSYAPPTKGTWHAFLPFSRPVTPEEYRRVWKAAIKWLGVPSGIKTDFPARFWNSPSCPTGAPRDVVSQAGPHLDVDLMLSLAADEPPEEQGAVSDKPSPYGPAPEALIRHVAEYLNTWIESADGTGNTSSYQVCRVLVNDYALAESEVWPIFEAWNRHNARPSHPMSVLHHKMSESLSKPPIDFGAARESWEFLQALEVIRRPKPGSWEEDLQIARDQWEHAMQLADTPRTPVRMFVQATELVKRKQSATPWLIKGLMTQGGIGAIATEPKAGKTWAATEYAIAIASGTKCFGEYDTTQGGVAYFYAEDMETAVIARVKALCKTRGGVPPALFLQPRGCELDLCDDASVITLLASARSVPDLKLLVLDPLRDVHTGAEDSSDEMSQVTKRLRVMSGILGCAVVFVHHTSKGGADTNSRRLGQRMRGSGAIHGALDHALYMYDTAFDDGQIINSCAPEIKAAACAPAFRLTLSVQDDPVTNTAVFARWEVSDIKEACNDELITEVIDCIGNFEARHENAPTEKDMHKVIGGTRATLAKAMANGEKAGYMARNVLGGVSRGWLLTDRGKEIWAGMNAAQGA